MQEIADEFVHSRQQNYDMGLAWVLSEDLPFKNCKLLSLSQIYLRFFVIFTCQHTHSYCTHTVMFRELL